METAIPIIVGVVALGVGVAIGFVLLKKRDKDREEERQRQLKEAGEKVAGARKEAKLKARDDLLSESKELDRETRDAKRKLGEREKRLEKREDTLDSKLSLIDKKEQSVERARKKAEDLGREAEKSRAELKELIGKETQELSRISKLSREQARGEILSRVEEDIKSEMADLVRRRVERAKTEADDEARKIVLDSVHRLATDYVAESVVSTIDLPNDEMKGRIIGREGRNIRAFEKATGVDVIVDDTPGVVVVSGFDAVRREVARAAMEKLVTDGRIHPARIEDVVRKTETEVQKDIEETGSRTVRDLRLHGLNNRLTKLMGRLKYRTSYGQNCLQHSIETAELAGLLAEELKVDQPTAVRAGLLHDIGKAVDQETEGTHPRLGADLARRADERPEIVNAIEAHHEDIPVTSLYGVVIQVADAISAARPGARRESLEKYIKRLERLEAIANAHKGIEKAYAIQAGRELRVIAKAGEVDEPACEELARTIAKEIESELKYPGEVKVTLIRESRFIEYAR